MIFFFEKPYIFISRFMMNWEKKSQTEHLSQYMYLSGFRDVTILNGKVTKKKVTQ